MKVWKKLLAGKLEKGAPRSTVRKAAKTIIKCDTGEVNELEFALAITVLDLQDAIDKELGIE